VSGQRSIPDLSSHRGISKIARATGLSEDDVWDALQYLTSIGFVTPTPPLKLDD
jgi:hypothetical protein